MTTHSEDLVSLEELRSVLNAYAGPDRPRERPRQYGLRRLRPVLVAAVIVVVLAGAGVAIANGFGVFNGIRAAQHPQTGADVLDPETAAYLQNKNCTAGGTAPTCGPMVRGLLLDSTRLVGELPSGQKIYVIATTSGMLCAVLQGRYPPMACGAALSPSDPTTVQSLGDPATNQPMVIGVALDGVTAVSFRAFEGADMSGLGHMVTVPVKDNVWTYVGPSDALDSVTVHYEDGTSFTVDPSVR
jgi:hypothetical protein